MSALHYKPDRPANDPVLDRSIFIIVNDEGEYIDCFQNEELAVASCQLSYSDVGEIKTRRERWDLLEVITPDDDSLWIHTVQPKDQSDHL